MVSVTWTMMVKVPDVVGIPEIVPVPGFNDRPMGKAPLMMLQVAGGDIGTAVKVVIYEALTCPVGSGEETIVGTAKTGLTTSAM